MLGRHDFFWAIAATALNVGLWAAILPIAAHYLPETQTALWLTFVVLAGTAQLLELGFSPTLARSYSYVFAGAQTLQATGVTAAGGEVNRQLLAELVHASRTVYRAIGVLAALVLWGGGSLYLMRVAPPGISTRETILAWIVFSSGNVVSFLFGYPNALILGRGDVKLSNKVLVWSRSLQLVGSVCGLVAGGGLLCLGLAAFASNVAGRLIAYHFVRDEVRESTARAPSRAATTAVVRMLWHNAGRYGLVMVGAFLITRANILIAGLQIGVVSAAGYNFTMQVLAFLQSVANLPFNMLLPRLNSMWAQRRLKPVRETFGFGLGLGIVIFVATAGCFVVLGPPALHAIKGNLVLPGTGVMLLMCLAYLLELNHGICANLLTIANDVPFVAASLFTGVAIALTSWFVAPHFGVLGLVAAMAVWQVAYNNWQWPMRAARMLGSNYAQLLVESLLSLRRRPAVATEPPPATPT